MLENNDLQNSRDEYLVLATLDYTDFTISRVGLDFPGIYKVVAGPASKIECEGIIRKLIEDNPLVLKKEDEFP